MAILRGNNEDLNRLKLSANSHLIVLLSGLLSKYLAIDLFNIKVFELPTSHLAGGGFNSNASKPNV